MRPKFVATLFRYKFVAIHNIAGSPTPGIALVADTRITKELKIALSAESRGDETLHLL
jgi:hypothetical protein